MGLLSKGLSRDRVGILLWQGVFLCIVKTHPSIVFSGRENQSYEHVLILTQFLYTQIRKKSILPTFAGLHFIDCKPLDLPRTVMLRYYL